MYVYCEPSLIKFVINMISVIIIIIIIIIVIITIIINDIAIVY